MIPRKRNGIIVSAIVICFLTKKTRNDLSSCPDRNRDASASVFVKDPETSSG